MAYNGFNRPHAIHPNAIKRPTRNLPKRNRRGGAYVPARTSAQRRFHTKYTRMVAGMNNGCALVGRHGRAHRHRPYQTPLYIHAQFTQMKRVNNPTHTLGAEMHRALPPPLLKIKKCVYVMIWVPPWMTSFVLKQVMISVSLWHRPDLFRPVYLYHLRVYLCHRHYLPAFCHRVSSRRHQASYHPLSSFSVAPHPHTA